MDKFVTDPKKRALVTRYIFGSYNQWLLLMGTAKFRIKLSSLSHEEAKTDRAFQQVRDIGNEFAKGLRLLFFNRDESSDPIANLSLDYVGF